MKRALAAVAACLMLGACNPHNPKPVEPSTPPVSPSPTPSKILVNAPITYPEVGSKKFTQLKVNSRVLGTKGRIRKIRVMVESDIKGANSLPDIIIATLGDKRSWIGLGWARFQLSSTNYDFTIYLATPATRDVLCESGYDRKTSCRVGSKVVLNVARWKNGVKYYDDLALYRKYMINHEVGHYLGQWHQKCPGKGKPAPIMEQQTLGLQGCEQNPYPLINGKLVMGPSM
jgi:hypothetical protein